MTERGDDCAAAVSGDSRPMRNLLNRVMDIPGAIIDAQKGFLGEAKVFDMGCLHICRIRTGPHVLIRKAGSQPGTESEGRKIHIAVLLSGQLRFTHGARHFTLGPGQWAIAYNSDVAWVEMQSDVDLIVLVIPADEIGHVGKAIERIQIQALDGRSGAGRLFYEFVRMAVEEMPAINFSGRISFSDAIQQLLRATVLDLVSVRRQSVAHRLLYERICALIDRNLSDPDLSVEFLATKMRCTKRYLHLIFAKHNAEHTLKSYINHQRLLHCRDDILLNYRSGTPIAVIAHRWGFHDPSYFGRLFRRSFGASPGEYAAAEPGAVRR